MNETAYTQIISLDFMDVRTLHIHGGGEYGILYEFSTKTLYGEVRPPPPEGEPPYVPTTIRLTGVCPYCETIHTPLMEWNGDGLAVLDAGGLEFGEGDGTR